MHLSSPHAQRDDIQGLRALAVLSVLLFHLNAQWLPGGFIGVDIFFVISGYLITGILWRQKLSNQGSLMGFYAARIRRIVPAYVAMIAFSALAASVLFIESDYGRFAESVQSAGLFFSNVFFAAQADYFAPASHELPLLHTWSLAIEMQFYLLLPLLMRLLPARFIAPALWALLLVGLAASEWWLRVSDSGAVYFSLLARAPEFLVGGLLAIRTRPVFASVPMMHAASIAGLAMLLLSLVFFTSKTPFPGIASMLPCIGAALLIATPQGVLARVLSLRAMVGIGALSYSLYLWHWPVLALARYVSGEYILVPALMASCLVVMLLLSVLSYRLIEQPFRRPLPKRAWGAIAVAVGVLIGSAALLNPRLAPVPLPLTRYADEVGICHGDIEGDCVRGNKSAAREMLLLGDSHAAQLNLAADMLGKALPARIRTMSASSCIPIVGFDMANLVAWARPACEAQTAALAPYLSKAKTIVIAAMWTEHTAHQKTLDALEKLIADAEVRGAKVMVLAQVPMLAQHAGRADRLLRLFGRKQTATLDPKWQPANARVQALVARHPNAQWIDISDSPMFATLPFYEGQLIYADAHHLNEPGARAYGAALRNALSQ